MTKTRSLRRDSVAIVGGSIFAISIVIFFRIPLLPDIGRSLGMSTAQLGIVTTAFAIGRLSADIPVERLADRVTPLRMLAGAALMLAAGSTLFAIAPLPLWVIVASVILGIASTVTNTTGMTFFSTARRPRRGIAMAGFSSALLGGQALGPTIGAALGLGGVARIAGSLFGGYLSDRVSRRAALIPGLSLQAFGVGLLATSTVTWWLVAIIVMSLSSWSISVAATILADRVGSQRVGRLLGEYRFVGDLGLIVGPALTAILYQYAGKALAVDTVAGLLLASATACAIVVPETRWEAEAGTR